MPDTSDAEIAIESLLNLSGAQSNTRKHHRDERDDETAAEAPVPKLARLLRDGKGKFMFIGDAANLSFLQNIRRLVKSSIGDCPFTSDHLRHSMVESTPAPSRWAGAGELPSHLRPTLEESRELCYHYALATSGVIDLFDNEDFTRLQNSSSKDTEFTSSIYYLVLAIGAQVRRREGDQKRSTAYFDFGRQLAVLSFMDDPSVLTIQSYVLITMYMLGASRRNGAFMNLGIAVRAAYALGLHRSDTSALFCARERRARERVWKSVRVLDLFLSASLGRPPATSDAENDVTSWNHQATGHGEESVDTQRFSAIESICFIFERILTEVYCKRMVSTNVVESISQQHREWTAALPTGLKIDGLERRQDENHDDLRQLLFLIHLNTSYYWSIILLTRPFLVFRVSARIKQKRKPSDNPNDESNPSPLISAFADACVDSAVRSVDIVHELTQRPNIPKCLPLVINSIFVSALVIGVAFFGDFDHSFPLRRSLDQAEGGLRFFGTADSTAKRYVQIIEYLRAAVEGYVARRDRRAMDRRSRLVSHMFGQVLVSPSLPEHSKSPDPLGASNVVGEYSAQSQEQASNSLRLLAPGQSNQWYADTAHQEESYDQYDPTMTRSGFLADSTPISNQQSSDRVFTMLPPFAESGISQLSPDSSTLPSYAGELPFFSLLNDYDPMLNGSFILDSR